MNSTTLIIPKGSTFKLPEGRFEAVIAGFNVKEVETTRGSQLNATLLFEVTVPGMENSECLARKVLPLDLKAGSELRRFLTSLLGTQFWRDHSNQAVDFEQELVGRHCEVVLIHAKHDAERFDWPLVDVESIHLLQAQLKEADPN